MNLMCLHLELHQVLATFSWTYFYFYFSLRRNLKVFHLVELKSKGSILNVGEAERGH